MKIGIILHKIEKTNIFIVDVGWGQLRYFSSDNNYKEKDIILYESPLTDDWSAFDYDKAFYCQSGHFDCSVYEVDNNNRIVKSTTEEENKIKVICRFDDCNFAGNVSPDFNPNSSSAEYPDSNIIIARMDLFVYWRIFYTREYGCFEVSQKFDTVSNSLLFMTKAKERFPFPDEKEWLDAYTYARNEVEKLNIPKMIEELKVRYNPTQWTRRGSDYVEMCNYSISDDYLIFYGNLHDDYLNAIFPRYYELLYESTDDRCDYIHPEFEEAHWRKNPDGSSDFIETRFKGEDIEVFCTKKTKELQEIALKNYKSYNKDHHINKIAYHHIKWDRINKENDLFQTMRCIGKLIWGFKYHQLLEQITKENYQDLIKDNNTNHPIPHIPDKNK